MSQTSARTLYRDAALAGARSASLRIGVSILVEAGTIRWIRPADGEEDPDDSGLEVVDASGTTIVPGMVDAVIREGVRPTSSWFTATRSAIRPHAGGSGAWPGPTDRFRCLDAPACVGKTTSVVPTVHHGFTVSDYTSSAQRDGSTNPPRASRRFIARV
jgi:hypothetical protein